MNIYLFSILGSFISDLRPFSFISKDEHSLHSEVFFLDMNWYFCASVSFNHCPSSVFRKSAQFRAGTTKKTTEVRSWLLFGYLRPEAWKQIWKNKVVCPSYPPQSGFGKKSLTQKMVEGQERRQYKWWHLLDQELKWCNGETGEESLRGWRTRGDEHISW